MKILQKAVNRREKDVAGLKAEFESSKKNLETLVVKSMATLKQSLITTPKLSEARANSSLLQGTGRPSSASRTSSQHSKNTGSSRTLGSERLSLSNTKKNGLGQSRSKQPSESQNTQLTNLIRQVKSLQLEKEKQAELIDELRLANSLHCGEREHFEERMKTRTV